VSSRQLTTFSDYRYSPDAPDFLSAEEYCTYLESYSKKFGLSPHIHLSTLVTKVERVASGGHIVHYVHVDQVAEWHCDAVAICSGLHVTPNIPSIEGLGNVPVVMHSSEFKERKQFGIGKNILIVGSGETGMDLAHMAVTSDTNSVTLSHRDGFHVAPKVLNSTRPFSTLLTWYVACSRSSHPRHETHHCSTIECPIRCRCCELVRHRLRSSPSQGLSTSVGLLRPIREVDCCPCFWNKRWPGPVGWRHLD
jgi:cation diffusion facilitator CzcD-associated flavoprotein CzcO